MKSVKFISIFGSYKPKNWDEDYNAAYKIAFELSKKGYIIKNGGGSGIMEASTLGAKEAGGKSIRYILSNYSKKDKAKNIIECKTLFERLELLIKDSSAFILFSGGTGTLTELALTWELMNKGLLDRLPIICYKDYWRPVIDLFKKNLFYINQSSLDFIKFANSIDENVSLF